MSGERWRVAGLADHRAVWFRELARWSTSAALAVDFVKCVSAAEVRERLEAGEPISALLVGDGAIGFTRSLVNRATAVGVPVILVSDATDPAGTSLGATAILPERFEAGELMELLQFHAPTVTRRPLNTTIDTPERQWRGRLIAVTGTGGVGASVVAAALAQELSRDASNRGLVLLADFGVDCDQAVIHDTGDHLSGLADLAESCRAGWAGRDQLARCVLAPPSRGYHLLQGVRRHRDWPAVGNDCARVVLEGLTRTYRYVVACVEARLLSVGEIHGPLVAASMRRADVVAVVGDAGVLGVHRLVRAIMALVEAGVPAGCVVPVVSLAGSRRQRVAARAEISGAITELLAHSEASQAHDAVFVDDHGRAEAALRDGVELPPKLGRSVCAAVAKRLEDPTAEPGRSELHSAEPHGAEPHAAKPHGMQAHWDDPHWAETDGAHLSRGASR